MWGHQVLFGQRFEAGFGKAGSNYDSRVYNEQSATGAGGTDRRDNVGHHTMRGGSAPSGRQREDRLRFGQFSQVGLLDHVLGANLRGLKTPRTDPSPHRFGVSLCPAGSLWNCQHCSCILLQLWSPAHGSERTEPPLCRPSSTCEIPAGRLASTSKSPFTIGYEVDAKHV